MRQRKAQWILHRLTIALGMVLVVMMVNLTTSRPLDYSFGCRYFIRLLLGRYRALGCQQRDGSSHNGHTHFNLGQRMVVKESILSSNT